MIKTLIFDLGNVIVRFDHSRIIEGVAKFCDFSAEEIHGRMFHSQIVHDYDTGKSSSEMFFAQVKQALGLRMSFDDFAAAWNSTFDADSILPDELFAGLSAKYRLLILSDTNELHFEFLKQNLPLLRHFDDYVLSYEVGSIKPAAAIFQATLKKADCSPHECFFTDDRIQNIEGAQMVGINAVQFETPDKFYRDLDKINISIA